MAVHMDPLGKAGYDTCVRKSLKRFIVKVRDGVQCEC